MNDSKQIKPLPFLSKFECPMQEQMISERALLNLLQVGNGADNITSGADGPDLDKIKNDVDSTSNKLKGSSASTISNAQNIAKNQAKNTDATVGAAQQSKKDANAAATNALNKNSYSSKLDMAMNNQFDGSDE